MFLYYFLLFLILIEYYIHIIGLRFILGFLYVFCLTFAIRMICLLRKLRGTKY